MGLESRILDRSARVAIIGCGYVGLPLAMSFTSAGFHVTGIDVDERRVGQLRRGESYIADIPSTQLKEAVDAALTQKATRLLAAPRARAPLAALPFSPP